MAWSFTRPVSQTLWALTSAGGGSHRALFHGIGLASGVAVVLLLYYFFLAAQVPARIAFIAALLFYYRRQPIPALILFALAGFPKRAPRPSPRFL